MKARNLSKLALVIGFIASLSFTSANAQLHDYCCPTPWECNPQCNVYDPLNSES